MKKYILWKTLTIVLIPIAIKLKKASDYSPINALFTFEKLLELVVKNNWKNFSRLMIL